MIPGKAEWNFTCKTENGRMILESVENGPLIWPTIEENGVTRTKKYEELSTTKKIQADCDLKATNIILQGLPSDVYSLVNHHIVARIYGKESNYLCKHESQCKNEVRIMRERNQDPLALLRKFFQPRQQATILMEGWNVQPGSGRGKVSFDAATSGKGLTSRNRLRVVKCFNGQVLNEEEWKLFADPRVAEASSYTKQSLHTIATYQQWAKGIFEKILNCHWIPDVMILLSAKAFLWQICLSYGSDVLSEVNKDNLIANESLSAKLERYKEWVKLLEGKTIMRDLNCNLSAVVTFVSAALTLNKQ
ncbi:hypothetical protein Tco_0457942 [Tanacetum coccineum]